MTGGGTAAERAISRCVTWARIAANHGGFVDSIGYSMIFGEFHSHGGTPIAGCFMRKNPTKMDDLGVPLFMETPIL